MPHEPQSWSRIETDEECQLAYKFRYIDKVEYKKPEPLRFGGAFHEFRFRYFETCREANVDSDWSVVEAIAKACFHEKDLPMERWDEFYKLCDDYAHNRPFNPRMGIEIKFGVSRRLEIVKFEDADYFRGIVDGLEIDGERGTITDAKTSRSMALPFTQLRIYAAFMTLVYPEVREWKLVFDFVRFNRLVEERILAANLKALRSHVKILVEKIETRTKWKPQPGEHCLNCPFLSRCNYKIRGLEPIENEDDARRVMEDHWFQKAKAAQAKRLVRSYVSDFGEVETKTLRADYFAGETVSCDKPRLVRLLKVFHKKPLDYLEFPKGVLRKIMRDKELADDAANLIFIDQTHKFNIKKIGKTEEEPEEGQEEL